MNALVTTIKDKLTKPLSNKYNAFTIHNDSDEQVLFSIGFLKESTISCSDNGRISNTDGGAQWVEQTGFAYPRNNLYAAPGSFDINITNKYNLSLLVIYSTGNFGLSLDGLKFCPELNEITVRNLKVVGDIINLNNSIKLTSAKFAGSSANGEILHLAEDLLKHGKTTNLTIDINSVIAVNGVKYSPYTTVTCDYESEIGSVIVSVSSNKFKYKNGIWENIS